MSNFVIPVLITLVVVIILSIIFKDKDKDKVDRGFKINYYKLSYRRKMIRTIIFIPIDILLIIFIFVYTSWSMAVNVLVGLLLIAGILVQLIYNFNRWKKTENS